MKAEPTIAALEPVKMEVPPGIYAICACGLSSNQPFCDGSHAGTSFQPAKVTIETKRMVSWCMCKHSTKFPFCDDTHVRLQEEMEERKQRNLP